MNTNIISGMPRAVQWQHDILCGEGFERAEDGYRRGDMLFKLAGQWSSLSLPWAGGADPLGKLGVPGPWKHVDYGPESRLVFPFPGFVINDVDVAGSDDDDEAHDDDAPSLASCIAWAVATAGGNHPKGWESPDAGTIASWTEGNLLTIEHESIVRQIEVISEPGRFALRVPLATKIPGDLPDAHRRWLRKVLGDAQNCWHLVRLGFAEESGEVVAIAEVDLTGVPEPVARRFLLTGADSLRWVVAWLVETAEFLVDAPVASQALEICPPK